MTRPPVPVAMPSAPDARGGRVTRWLRRLGEFVRAGDPLAEIAGTRAGLAFDLEVEAPRSGVLGAILVAGGRAQAGETLGLIEPAPAPHRPPNAADGAPVSPRARRLARDHGLDVAGLAGSGPAGRIVERDIRAALAAAAFSATAAAPLVTAWEPVPQAALECECDLDALDVFRAHRPKKFTLTDCALRAFALALAGEAQWAAGDVAVATLAQGLPAAAPLPGAAFLSLDEIAAARRGFGKHGGGAARAFEASALLVNAGPLGVKRLFPALSPPWTLMLVLGAAEARPVARAGALAVARMVSVTLTLDRRVVETVEAARVLQRFQVLMEQPARLENPDPFDRNITAAHVG